MQHHNISRDNRMQGTNGDNGIACYIAADICRTGHCQTARRLNIVAAERILGTLDTTSLLTRCLVSKCRLIAFCGQNCFRKPRNESQGERWSMNRGSFSKQQYSFLWKLTGRSLPMPLLTYNPENPIDQQAVPVFQLENCVAALA